MKEIYDAVIRMDKVYGAAILDDAENKGMGLANIRSRVKSVDGLSLMESSKGNGMHALIKVNIEEENIIEDYE